MQGTVARINLYREWAEELRLKAQEYKEEPVSRAFAALADMVDRAANDLEQVLA